MLHKHAATIRPYPLPTRQHAAARPNSRQIRQMTAIPANPPFHSQLAARPNNRRHHQPTAAHPQTTSTPNLSQTLMISRQTLTRAPLRQRRPSHPENPPNIPKITVQTTVKHSPGHSSVRVAPPIPKIPPNPKNHSSDNGQTLARPLVCSRRPSHPKNPPKSQKSQFRQRSNTRPIHSSVRYPPLPSRKSTPQIPTIQSQFRQSAQLKSQPIPKIPVPCTNGFTKN